MSATREEWLESLAERVAPLLSMPVPKVRLSVGFPGGRARGRGKRIGECWDTAASSDGSAAIFVSPTIADAATAAHVLVHEMIHAAVGVKHGHRGPFRRVALAIGLTGKMTATTATPELADKLAEIVDEIGPYPHAALNADLSGRKKQSTRMKKITCGACGYTARTTEKWLAVGTPVCPCGVKMSADADADAESEAV